MSEKIKTVDTNGKFVGIVERDDLKIDGSMIPWVVGLILVNNLGEVALAKRDPNKKIMGGVWSLPVAGHVDESDVTAKDALEREIAEESNLNNIVLENLYGVLQTLPSGRVQFMNYFLATINNGQELQLNPKDFSEVKFFSEENFDQFFASHHDEASKEKMNPIHWNVIKNYFKGEL